MRGNENVSKLKTESFEMRRCFRKETQLREQCNGGGGRSSKCGSYLGRSVDTGEKVSISVAWVRPYARNTALDTGARGLGLGKAWDPCKHSEKVHVQGTRRCINGSALQWLAAKCSYEPHLKVAKGIVSHRFWPVLGSPDLEMSLGRGVPRATGVSHGQAPGGGYG
jgi:hypothetical protein